MARIKSVRHHGPSIKAWRDQRGMTADQLAKLVGYKTPHSLLNVEREHKATIPFPRLLRIADALTVDPAVLLREPLSVRYLTACGHHEHEQGAA